MIKQYIINFVCNKCEITIFELLSEKRTEDIINAKQAVVFSMINFGFSQNDIAEALGYADHSSVNHLLNTRDYKKDESAEIARECALTCVPYLMREIKRLNKKLEKK